MFRNSIRQKIVGIATGLIILAVITSLLSMVMASQVGQLGNDDRASRVRSKLHASEQSLPEQLVSGTYRRIG